jgi:N-formylglutamate deformylase
LVTTVGSFFRQNSLTVAKNVPFSGTFVPAPYYQKDKRVVSIMIEVNRASYMDEKIGRRNHNFATIKEILDALFKTIIGGNLVSAN